MLKIEKLSGTVKVVCPYCNVEQNKFFEGSHNQGRIVSCDIEDVAGCDQAFVLFIYVTPDDRLFQSTIAVNAKVAPIGELLG
jgi:hypothetical protein